VGAHFGLGGLLEGGAQVRVKRAGFFQPADALSTGGVRHRAQPGHHPQSVSELLAHPAEPAVAHTRRKQSIAGAGVIGGEILVAQVAQTLHGPQDVGLHTPHVAPVLGQFGLPHERENGDARVLEMSPPRPRVDPSVGILLRPGCLQSLLRLPIIAEVARRFEQEVAVHNPQAAIHRRPDLERELAVPHLARLLDVARAGDQELVVTAAHAPFEAARERVPVAPVLARGFEQSLRLAQPSADLLQVLTFLRETEQDALWDLAAGRAGIESQHQAAAVVAGTAGGRRGHEQRPARADAHLGCAAIAAHRNLLGGLDAHLRRRPQTARGLGTHFQDDVVHAAFPALIGGEGDEVQIGFGPFKSRVDDGRPGRLQALRYQLVRLHAQQAELHHFREIVERSGAR